MNSLFFNEKSFLRYDSQGYSYKLKHNPKFIPKKKELSLPRVKDKEGLIHKSIQTINANGSVTARNYRDYLKNAEQTFLRYNNNLKQRQKFNLSNPYQIKRFPLLNYDNYNLNFSLEHLQNYPKKKPFFKKMHKTLKITKPLKLNQVIEGMIDYKKEKFNYLD